MQDSDDKWEEWYFSKILNEEREYLFARRDFDDKFTPDYLRLMLKELYQSEGDGWIGKEALNELRQAAKIAAYEGFLADWEQEIEDKNKNEAKGEEKPSVPN